MWESIKWLIPSVTAPTVADGLAAAAIIVVGLLGIRFMIRPLLFKIADLFNKKNHPVLGDITKSVYPSIRNAIIFSLIVMAASLLVEVWLFDNAKLGIYIDSVYVFFAFKALYDVLGFYLKNPHRFETGKDQDILTPFFLRMSKVAVMVIAMFTIASLWNFNLNGFLTAIGLTGVALAFGIRDTLAHIFGGMSVALDKPFQIGDWVMSSDEKIDGTIQDINLRSTVIQTSDKGTVYVPNSYLVNRPIYNLSNRTERKVEHFLHISNENNEGSIVKFMESVREQISLHPKISKKIIHVAMDELMPTSCRILIRYFVETNDTGIMLQVRQEILFVAKHYCEVYDIKLVDPNDGQYAWNNG
ncbi:mechanosensitive ion channel family protein [Solibacillus isronensis]|uniref:mechanosensitive ion channel family protein n=2 Tax=Solibacillus TaxID=648800 RepID=UPI0020415333|nr:mechanosensitive ion channel domain-containing protein [Solibacillus isronensis]MCM3720907.1 mechanosensitive ion channel family protein [Solibacillus isronensis]